MIEVNEAIKIWYRDGVVHIKGESVRASVKLSNDQIYNIYKGYSENSDLELAIDVKGTADA